MQRPHLFRALLLLLAPLLGGGCSPDGDRILNIDATGTVSGVVFIDRNGNGKLDAVDVQASSVGVSLLVRGTTLPLFVTTTSSTGTFVFPSVPVGMYQLALDGALLGDSIRDIAVDPAQVTVAASDTATAVVVLTERTQGIEEVRRLPAGRRVSIEGIALNSWGVFRDSSVYVSDRSNAIRLSRVTPMTVSNGDSLRIFGTLDMRDGQPVLASPTVFVLGRTNTPVAARITTTAVAARADGGTLDASPVRVLQATVLSVSDLPGGGTRFTVTDGSALLEVVLEPTAGITPDVPLMPGVVVDVAGVLSPTGNGSWTLLPRARGDIVARIPRVGIERARQLPAGTLVTIEGIALNGSVTFADSAVYVADSTAAIRVTRLPATVIFAGDRVRVVGTLGFFSGQPALVNLTGTTPSVFGKESVPAPLVIGTGTAATADNGTLDGRLVRVRDAVVVEDSTATPPPTGPQPPPTAVRPLIVDSGSGPLQVQIDPTTGISTGIYDVGVTLDIVGILVPSADGRTWVIKPRSRADISAQ